MASHAFITTWLMAPGGKNYGSVDWNAGTQLGGHGVFRGNPLASGGQFTIASVSDNNIKWNPCNEESLGKSGSYNGPDVYVFWMRKSTEQVIGGFLDHWTIDRPRNRSFNNIKDLWHMNPKIIYQQASHVRLGLQGNAGNKISSWYQLR